MSNAEETPESSLKIGSLVDDFLESGREKAKISLSTDEKHIEDLEYISKSVKALIKIINEIWDNCEEHLTSREGNNSPFTFQRRVFKEAKVEKGGRNLIITTQKVSDMKDFGSLPVVPANLGEMITIGQAQAESDILPNYNKYLEKSSILCEVVLLPFLTGFKEHLENVQVYLGQIEAWLLEPEIVGSFLKKTFNGPNCRVLDKKDPHKIILFCSYCVDVDSRMESKYNLCTEDGRKGLKAALAFIQTYKPITQIEVKDAGEKAVNGTYTINGVFGDNFFYSRSGLWGGKPVKFYLGRRQDKKTWCISYNDENHPGIWVVFYWTKGTGEEFELPPLNGWRNEVNNNFYRVYPPPQILYKIDD